ncbi:hypothetical protein ACKKBG_A13135 [Auxenochlorella protothecoides x Auxenochlorella symbiontica]
MQASIMSVPTTASPGFGALGTPGGLSPPVMEGAGPGNEQATGATAPHRESSPGGAGPQKAFMSVWKRFMKSKGLDASPAMFNRGVMDVYKLFRLVIAHGGFQKVSEGKLWARIGRAFNPPQSMTDLSYQTKKVYISKLSAFEEAYHAGEVSVNLDAEPEPDVPDAVPQHSQTHKLPSHKRKLGESYMTGYSEVPAARQELIGRTISVLWHAEGSHHVGTVAQYHPDLDQYTVVYHGGEVHQTDLKAVEWVLVDGQTAATSHPQDATANGREDANDATTKVYASSSGLPGFEIFTSLPGIRLEEVSVRCWPDGKLVIQGKPSTPGVQDIREDLQLPLLAGQRLLAHSAQALFTDTGRLYVKVVLAPPKTPGGEASPLPSGTPAQQVPAPRAPLGQAY